MGEVFAGRYELADPIGRGGVGAVWRAWDHRRRRYVAAKVLQQRDAHSLLRFVREQALRIDHPHVLAPASWAADDDKVLFTMDLVGGGSLVHLVGDYGPLPAGFVCTLLDQLLAGLAAVHEEGVVHRDVKPANVLLEATGTGRPRLRLSDFGIAMRLGEPRLTETNLVVGTPGYLAPEQMMGAEPDFPADLFAVGLVALYLLEGAKPDAKALVEYFAEHGTPAAPKGIPEALWQVVASLLQPDPQARFRTATGARKALAAAVELLPEPGPDDEQIEVFDQLGPLPPGFGPDGPLRRAPGVDGRGGTRPEGTPAQGTPPGGTPAEQPVGDTAGSRRTSDAVPDDPRRSAESPLDEEGGAHRPGFPPGGPSQPPTPSQPYADAENTPSPPLTMSDTGSFHLPPPQPTASSPGPAAAAPHTPAVPPPPAAHAAPAYTPPPHRAHDHDRPSAHQGLPHALPQDTTYALPVRPQNTATASYTAQTPQAPQASLPGPEPTPPATARHRARRPGPPAMIAVPLLLLALVCYGVGFWALARV